jgi:spermidine synthase
VLLVDACDRVGIAPELDDTAFYRNARRCLSPGGVFVTNVCGDMSSSAAHLAKIGDVFGAGFVTLQVRQDGNIIAFAFKERRPAIDWAQLQATAVDLKRGLGLDFPRYLRRMALNWTLRRWQHVFV